MYAPGFDGFPFFPQRRPGYAGAGWPAKKKPKPPREHFYKVVNRRQQEVRGRTGLV